MFFRGTEMTSILCAGLSFERDYFSFTIAGGGEIGLHWRYIYFNFDKKQLNTITACFRPVALLGLAVGKPEQEVEKV